MKRIIKLISITAVLFIGILSCDKDNSKDSNMYLGHEYVDLGLSVKWATCNVGATTPEGYGDYFAWGDVTTYYQPGYAQSDVESIVWKDGKTGYNWSSYKYCKSHYMELTKYCGKSSYGYKNYTDSDTTLVPVDDVASYNWGGNWRMPTRAEIKELLDNCKCEFTTQNGVCGLKVTSIKDSSCSIFLPAAGYRKTETLFISGEEERIDLSHVGFECHYWSSSLCTNFPVSAWTFESSPDTRDMKLEYHHFIGLDDRECGLVVRPVCP